MEALSSSQTCQFGSLSCLAGCGIHHRLMVPIGTMKLMVSPYCWDKANRAVTRELMAIKHDYRLIRGWNKTGLTALRCQGDN